jgi:hypothetical protein
LFFHDLFKSKKKIQLLEKSVLFVNRLWNNVFFFFKNLKETVEDTGSEGAAGDPEKTTRARRRRYSKKTKTVVNPDENFYFYWLMVLTICVLYNLWTLIVRQSFPELQVSPKKRIII